LGRPFQEKVYENSPDYVDDLENMAVKVHAFACSHMSSDVMKKTYYHKIHQKLHNPGDPVWYYQYHRKVSLNPKLQRPWHGPFVAIERLNDVMYCIKDIHVYLSAMLSDGGLMTVVLVLSISKYLHNALNKLDSKLVP
jgi:hypothetical protein